jgi:branched-chain amino acid transport system ATP-binding protein
VEQLGCAAKATPRAARPPHPPNRLILMLTLTNVQIVYDNTIEAVREASLALGKQQIVALLGANGAGKSTTLKAISGVLYPEDGEVKGGQITFEGQPLTGMTPDRIVRAGVVMVPEGRRLFDQLTVEENLLMGGYTRSVAESKRGLERVYATFPRLTPSAPRFQATCPAASSRWWPSAAR